METGVEWSLQCFPAARPLSGPPTLALTQFISTQKGMIMTNASAQTESTDGLSDVLNKLAGPERLNLSDVASERQKLADMSQGFNRTSNPVAEKLAAALPGISDCSSRWITARMLHDTGLIDETKGEFALTALCTALSSEKDPGSRYMIASLVRDIGQKYESLSAVAAAAIADTLSREKDHYSRVAEKNSLMAVGTKFEAAGAVAAAGIAKALQDEADPYTRILFAGDLRALGTKWPAQSSDIVGRLILAVENEKEIPALRHLTQNITTLVQENPEAAPAALQAFTAGILRETRSDAISAFANGLMALGAQNPLAVIAAIDQDYEGFKGIAGRDKRRMMICNLSNLAETGPDEAQAASQVLIGKMTDEPEAFHRRLIIAGLMNCAREGIDTTAVKEELKEQLVRERDRETRDTLERNLRSLGYVKPYGHVVTFPPAPA